MWAGAVDNDRPAKVHNIASQAYHYQAHEGDNQFARLHSHPEGLKQLWEHEIIG
jgi:hypothetical protein